MFRKALLTTAAAVAMFALSSVARADTVTLTGINGTGVTATVTNYSLSGNTSTFTIKGDFSGLTAAQVANSIFARFQNVNPGGSDVAGPGNPNPVPEPMTM